MNSASARLRCAKFRGRDRFVDVNILFAHRRADKAEDFHQNRGRRAGGQDRIGHDKGAHIDEGIAGDAGVAFQLQDRVESQTRGLAANTGPEPVAKAAERIGKLKFATEPPHLMRIEQL